jgi:hypothetical protein
MGSDALFELREHRPDRFAQRFESFRHNLNSKL